MGIALLPKGFQTNYLKLFWLKIFFHLLTYISASFRKNSKQPSRDIQGLGETNSWKQPEVENLVALSLYCIQTIAAYSFLSLDHP